MVGMVLDPSCHKTEFNPAEWSLASSDGNCATVIGLRCVANAAVSMGVIGQRRAAKATAHPVPHLRPQRSACKIEQKYCVDHGRLFVSGIMEAAALLPTPPLVV